MAPVHFKVPALLNPVVELLLPGLSRLELSLAPSLSIKRLRQHHWSWRHDGHYLFLACLAIFNLSFIPSFALSLVLILAYATLVLVPLTSQFVLPATPIFSWLLLFFSSRYLPVSRRPHIWVTVLPTLESVLYGANISDILTRYTHPFLDILAWLPYGVVHFVSPFVAAAAIFFFGPPGGVKYFGRIFGYMNLIGVLVQISFPCTPPWYELLYGLTPANYGMKGSAGGLMRIDAIFGSHGYKNTFENAPVPFGAFPSLHAGSSTVVALLLSHFFPQGRPFYWSYVLVLYWATMYLSHHYLIDVTAGASLAVLTFYLLMTDELRAMAPNQTGPNDEFVSSYAADAERAFVNKVAHGANTHNTWLGGASGPSGSAPHPDEQRPLSRRGSESDDVESPRNLR